MSQMFQKKLTRRAEWIDPPRKAKMDDCDDYLIVVVVVRLVVVSL